MFPVTKAVGLTPADSSGVSVHVIVAPYENERAAKARAEDCAH